MKKEIMAEPAKTSPAGCQISVTHAINWNTLELFKDFLFSRAGVAELGLKRLVESQVNVTHVTRVQMFNLTEL